MAAEYPKILSRLAEKKISESATSSEVFTIAQKIRLWQSRENVLKILKDRGIKDTSPNASVPLQEFLDWIGEDSEHDTMNYMTMQVKKPLKGAKSAKGENGTKGEKPPLPEEITLVMWIAKAGVPELESIANMAKLNDITNVIIVVCNADIKHPAKAFVAAITKLKVYFQLYTIAELQYHIADHYLVPKHTFATKKEIRDLKTEYCVSKAQLPKIASDDAMVRHLGARVGDVLKIKRPSETFKGYFDIAFRVVS